MITYAYLKDKPKEFLAATGLTHAEFLQLLPVFSALYQAEGADKTLARRPRQRQPGGGAKGMLLSMADKLLFILVYQKTYPLQTMQGLHFGLSQPQANYWIHRLLPFLKRALAALGHLPARDPAALTCAWRVAEAPADLLFDGTERRRQRPQDAQEQRAHYSGKKKTHTDKNLLLGNTDTDRVIYLGPTTPGKTHDKKMADDAQLIYPSGTTLGKDAGFQGYEPAAVVTYQPKKKPKGQTLTAADRCLNRILAGVRIQVEHMIAGVKRCRIVKDTLRNTKPGFSDLVMEVACALHNFRVACRHPQPTFNVLDFVAESYSR
jgi:hypothetical protein